MNPAEGSSTCKKLHPEHKTNGIKAKRNFEVIFFMALLNEN
tara:strand:+ start:2421 stop:2543 length:123 start_codon:yes stop_codon:yes gene_type:complete